MLVLFVLAFLSFDFIEFTPASISVLFTLGTAHVSCEHAWIMTRRGSVHVEQSINQLSEQLSNEEIKQSNAAVTRMNLSFFTEGIDWLFVVHQLTPESPSRG